MKRRSVRRGMLLVLIAIVTLGGWQLFERLWGDYERPVTLLSEQVTLGPEPLVIRAPRGTSASGTSFWLTVYLVRETICEKSEWAKGEAEPLPAINAVVVTSDGQRHSLSPSDCCAASTCGALTLYDRTDSYGGRRLVRIELSAPEPVPIDKVTWDSWESEIRHLSR